MKTTSEYSLQDEVEDVTPKVPLSEYSPSETYWNEDRKAEFEFYRHVLMASGALLKIGNWETLWASGGLFSEEEFRALVCEIAKRGLGLWNLTPPPYPTPPSPSPSPAEDE
jgi:hypothetical protein